MTKSETIKEIEKLAKVILGNDSSGHDFLHTERVLNIARRINKKEKGDEFVVAAASLLHDVVDWKVENKITYEELERRLLTFKINQKDVEKIMFVVRHVSFSSKQPRKKTLELKIVQDADRLDALGAIGIARTFAYGGKSNRPIYDPLVRPAKIIKKKDYRQRTIPSINHFYEKILKLKDLMNTKTGKKLAHNRHKFIEIYLKEFFLEWEGKR